MLLYFFFENRIMTEIISSSIPAELRMKIDRVRGDIPRSKYIVSLLESVVSKHLDIEPSTGTSSEATNQQK